MEEIEEWFCGGKNFAAGLILYSKYGQYRSVHATLSSMGENAVTRKTLEEHLRRVRDSLKSTLVSTTPTAVNKQPTAQPSATFAPKNDASDIRKKANKMFGEMAVLISRVTVIKSVAERKALMGRFHKLHWDWCQFMFKADYYEEHGVMPPALKEPKKKTKVRELNGNAHSELMLLRSKVTRAINDQIPEYKRKLKEKFDQKIKDKMDARIKEVELWKARIIVLENGNNGRFE